MTSDHAQVTVPVPTGLPADWTARVPELTDLEVLLRLRGADRLAHTGSPSVDREAIESEVAGPASWTRRQLLAIDRDGVPRAWISVHDRAAGRTMVALYVDRAVEESATVAAALYAWGEEQAREICVLREVTETRLDASPFADDTVQQQWLTTAGYTKRRTWPQMTRPVTPEEATSLPAPREGVTLRRVASHENGLPVAGDLHLVHEMLESSFEDHFNSYRESFPEFVQRLREDPGHRWDHWWLAFVEGDDGRPLAAGALVGTVLRENAEGHEGSYVEYIGVHRDARGRGVAKALLHAVIADAAQRGRDRVGLEVDADSPTGADGLYSSMGWKTDYVLESWFKDVDFSTSPTPALP
ncbi:MAG: family N-acetyltransferase [Marmoricola sp.]|nr:family N-acetyltransferase [Marmoricola sp.]